VEDTNAAVKYTGTWFPNSNGVHSGGRAMGSMDANSRATFTFTGTGFRWIGYRDQWSGIARVLVDGVDAGTVDTFAKADAARTVLFTKTGLTSGTHTVAIVAAGTRGAASSGAWVWVDAFEVVR
jgi:hypothetical protein